MIENQHSIDCEGMGNVLFEFYLLSAQKGERYIFYKDTKGEKLIKDVDKIRFTEKSLFEEMQTGFSAFSYLEGSYPDYFLDDEKSKLNYREICSLIAQEKYFFSEFCRLHMNRNELQLFKDLLNFLIKYCSENGIRLTMKFDVEPNFMADVENLLDSETFRLLCKYLKDCEKKSEKISYDKIDDWVIKNTGKSLVELEILKTQNI